MKRYSPLFVCLILCLCLLAGCSCKHEWNEATCQLPKTCSLCGQTEGETVGHSWASATCTAPKTCTVCALTEGEALEHSWIPATCQSPETCSTCGLAQGGLLNHAFGVWSLNTATETMIENESY